MMALRVGKASISWEEGGGESGRKGDGKEDWISTRRVLCQWGWMARR